LLAGIGIIFSSTFQALGEGMFSLYVSLCRQLVVLLPVAYLLSRTGNVNAVWWAFPIAETFSLTLSVIFMLRTNKTIIAPMYAGRGKAAN
jgi:Na+-driven multidrug efflux pump